MSSLLCRACLALLAAGAIAGAHGQANDALDRMTLVVQPLEAGTAPRKLAEEVAGRPVVILFWRTDCAPCLEEIRMLPALREAAQPMRLLLLGLEDSATQRELLEKLDVEPSDAWYRSADPAGVLTAFGGYPPRLPLSVVLDAHGGICARRIGQLGPALVREWRSLCATDWSEDRT